MPEGFEPPFVGMFQIIIFQFHKLPNLSLALFFLHFGGENIGRLVALGLLLQVPGNDFVDFTDTNIERNAITCSGTGVFNSGAQ